MRTGRSTIGLLVNVSEVMCNGVTQGECATSRQVDPTRFVEGLVWWDEKLGIVHILLILS